MGGMMGGLGGSAPKGATNPDYEKAYQNLDARGEYDKAPDVRASGWRASESDVGYDANWYQKHQDTMREYSANFRKMFIEEMQSVIAARTGQTVSSEEVNKQIMVEEGDKKGLEQAAQQAKAAEASPIEEPTKMGEGAAQKQRTQTVLTSTSGVEGHDTPKRKTLLGG